MEQFKVKEYNRASPSIGKSTVAFDFVIIKLQPSALKVFSCPASCQWSRVLVALVKCGDVRRTLRVVLERQYLAACQPDVGGP